MNLAEFSGLVDRDVAVVKEGKTFFTRLWTRVGVGWVNVLCNIGFAREESASIVQAIIIYGGRHSVWLNFSRITGETSTDDALNVQRLWEQGLGAGGLGMLIRRCNSMGAAYQFDEGFHIYDFVDFCGLL